MRPEHQTGPVASRWSLVSAFMLGSALQNETESGRLMKQPDEIGGAQTPSTYVVVWDADADFTRGKVGGASAAMEIRDKKHGGGAFRCHDLEGHLCSFGTYDPWPLP